MAKATRRSSARRAKRAPVVANWLCATSLSLEEGPGDGETVRFTRRWAQQSRAAAVWLRDAVSTAVNGHEFHPHVGIVALQQLLDVNAVSDIGLLCLRLRRD